MSLPTCVATALSTSSGADGAREVIRALEAQLGGAKPALVVTFVAIDEPLQAIGDALQQAFPSAVVVGLTASGEFTQEESTTKAVVGWALAGDFEAAVGLGEGASTDPEKALLQALEGATLVPNAALPHQTALLLLDGLCGKGEDVSLLASMHLGAGTSLAGAMAGDDLTMQATWIYANGRAVRDGVGLVRLASRDKPGVGIAHGHRAISKVLTVTKAAGPVVYEVNGEPAYDVWLREAGEAARKVGAHPDQLGDLPLAVFLGLYEAGLETGNELKIRAPLARLDGGAIAFACALPEGAEFRITEGTKASQIASARKAVQMAKERLEGRPVAGALVFDCACRRIILGADFGSSVRAMKEELGAPLAGMEGYGEIALDAGDMTGFHNTTSVVVAFAR